MEYKQFLETKEKTFIDSGFDIEQNELNSNLFDFQKYVIQIALKKGRFALFEDCGLGKTIQQLSWAEAVYNHTNKPVLILAPLAVVEQTKDESIKFGIDQNAYEITNYEQLKNIPDVSIYSGVVLDESSILKNEAGKLAQYIIDIFKKTPYKLACTATPSPNDHMELGQHSEFLGAMNRLEMLAMYFVHDSSETQKWRLRKHAVDDFWKFVCTWSISIDNPCNIGFESDGYNLPEIEFIEHSIPVDNNSNELFPNAAVSATELHQDLKRSYGLRLSKTKELVNSSDEQWIVWTLKNDEAKDLSNELEDSINVQGSDKPEYKAKHLNGFAKKQFKTLITKTSIASFGMNYQQCYNMVFTSYDFKFEAFYQAVRRCYRFGQKNKVKVHLLVPESQMNVRKTIIAKDKKHKEMIREMTKYSNETDYRTADEVVINNKEVKTDNYHLFNGDCVQEIKKVKDNSADMIVFSPPFADLYVYSDKNEDMGNVSSYEEFKKHFSYLVPELKRVLKPGRVCAVHCMDLPTQKGRDGYIGIRRFSDMLANMFEDNDMFLHSEFTIWKDPLLAAVRTKTIGLAHKQLMKDSVISRCGIPDKVLCFKTKEDNEVPVAKDLLRGYIPMHEYDPFPKTIKGFNERFGYNPESKYPKEEQYSHHIWQRYASPIWLDIDVTDVLKYTPARDNNDEKHICPLQLPVIERLITLYSNEGETVLSPFGGIGSEGFQALKMNRKSISIELKESYFRINEINHRNAISQKLQTKLF